MKRIISIILVLIMLFSISCFGETTDIVTDLNCFIENFESITKTTKKLTYTNINNVGRVTITDYGDTISVNIRNVSSYDGIQYNIESDQFATMFITYTYANIINNYSYDGYVKYTKGTKSIAYSNYDAGSTYPVFADNTITRSIDEFTNDLYNMIYESSSTQITVTATHKPTATPAPKTVKLKYSSNFKYTDSTFGGKIVASFSNVKCIFDDSGIWDKITFTYEGNVTARKGSGNTFWLEYEIYDSANYMIQSGTLFLDVPSSGKFKGSQNIYLDCDLVKGKTYTIKFQ